MCLLRVVCDATVYRRIALTVVCCWLSCFLAMISSDAAAADATHKEIRGMRVECIVVIEQKLFPHRPTLVVYENQTLACDTRTLCIVLGKEEGVGVRFSKPNDQA